MKKVPGSKILNHPDKEDIIRMLNEGESVRGVVAYIQQKYPKSKNLWVSLPTIQNFRKTNLNLSAEVLKDIQDATKKEKRAEDEIIRQEALKSSSSYQETIKQIAHNHLDVQSKILQLDAVVSSRIEYWYNLAASGEELPGKADRELRPYIDQQLELMKNWKKLVEGQADKTVDLNINIQNSFVQDQLSVIRDVVIDIVKELDVDSSMRFMALFHDKMKKLEYDPAKAIEVSIQDEETNNLLLAAKKNEQ